MKKTIQVIFSLICVAFCGASVQAASKWWDIDGTGPGAATAAGNWDLTTSNWQTTDSQTATPELFTNNDVAVFSAGNNVCNGSFTVTLTAAILADGLTVEEGTVSIVGAANGDTLGGGTTAGLTINIASGLTSTNGVKLHAASQNNPYIKTGDGTLVLTSSVSDFSSQLRIEAGTVLVATINAANATGPLGEGIGSGKDVSLGTTSGGIGTLRYTGSSVTLNANRRFQIKSGGTGVFQIDGLGTNVTIPGLITNSTTADANGQLKKTGAGVLKPTNGGNTFGNVTISDGKFQVSGVADAGIASTMGQGSTVTIQGGSTSIFSYTGTAASMNRGFVLGSGGGTIESTTDVLTLTGGVTSSPANQPLTIGGAGSVTISTTALNIGTGDLTKTNGGTLTLSIASTYGATIISGGTLKLGASNVIPDGSAVTISGGATLNLVSSSDTVGAVTLISGTISSSSGILTGSSYDVQSGSVVAGLAGATVALTKTTTGTVTLDRPNTYAGATTVSAGTLLVNGPFGSIAAGSAVSVGANATLGGTGTINGPVNVLAGGHLLPGASPGILTLAGNLAFAATADSTFELTNSTSSDNDQVVLTGSATLDGAGSTINITPLDTLATADYVLFDLTGSSGGIIGNFATTPGWTGPPPGNASEYTIITSGKQVLLHWTSPSCTMPTAYGVTGGGAYCSGGSGVAVGLASSESGVTYQLYRNGGVTPVGTTVTANPGNPITFGNQTVADTYTVVATRTSGSCTNDMTGSATVTVNAATAINNQPTNQAVCAISPAVFTVDATGAGLTYQWQASGNAGITFTNITSNATGASYTNPGATPADNGLQYQVIVTGTCGPAVTSAPPAVLTVSVPVLSIVQQGTNVVISWAVSCLDYVLEKKSDVDPQTSWSPVTEPVIPVGGKNTVTIPMNSTNQFFRLLYSPAAPS